MKRQIDKSQWKQVVQDRLSKGANVKQICSELGCCQQTISAFIRNNFDLPNGTIDQNFRAQMMKDQLTNLAGLSYGVEDIGPQLGISPQTAATYLKILGIPYSRKPRPVYKYDTSTWNQTVLKWYRDGLSRKEIGQKMGIGEATIQRYLTRMGVSKRKNRYA